MYYSQVKLFAVVQVVQLVLKCYKSLTKQLLKVIKKIITLFHDIIFIRIVHNVLSQKTAEKLRTGESRLKQQKKQPREKKRDRERICLERRGNEGGGEGDR